ncbi:MAG: DUF2065 domain-containing protein [Desulfonauticus sp.]|nr:DUF2065 domain-containing protein [Desulfonauticus sp.]
MQVDWNLFLSAAGLALIFEGIPYFLWAEKMPNILNLLASQPPANLRKMGFTSILLGLLILYLCRG